MTARVANMKISEDANNTNIRTQRELITSLHIDSSRSTFFTTLFNEENNRKFGQSVRKATVILIIFIVSLMLVSALKSGRVHVVPSNLNLHFVEPKEPNIIFVLLDSISENSLQETVKSLGRAAEAGTAVILESAVGTPKSKMLKDNLLSSIDKAGNGNETLLWVFVVAPDAVADYRGRIFSDNHYFSVINMATSTEVISCKPQKISTPNSAVHHRLTTTSSIVIVATNYLVDIPSKFSSIFTVAPAKGKPFLTISKGSKVEKDTQCPFVSAVKTGRTFKFQCVTPN
eukprot:Tbor_TRINITY_DN5451_c2_g1::TRINITY_DN5451_c2_g1_i1::g.25399::m.25399